MDDKVSDTKNAIPNEAIGKAGEDASARMADGNSSTWTMTRERLLAMPLGAECVKLAQIASFFSPDGCPRHILLHLWKTVVAPGQDTEKFSRALEIGMRHQIFQSADPVLVNSLDREAILKTAKEEQGLEEAIGKSLATYAGMSPIDWLLLADHIAILQLIPQDILIAERNTFFWRESFTMSDSAIGQLQVGLLCLNPAFESEVRWDAITLQNWLDLLCVQPQFADRCPFDQFDGHDWAWLLTSQPQFADRCAWEKLDMDHWALLLEEQPQFADRCPWKKLDELRGMYWVELLCEQPQFGEHCPWDKLSGFRWAELLGKQPQFADRCRWDKLEGKDWAKLLAQQPQFADRCPWKKFDELGGGYWVTLLAEQPAFADRCPWEKVDGLSGG